MIATIPIVTTVMTVPTCPRSSGLAASGIPSSSVSQFISRDMALCPAKALDHRNHQRGYQDNQDDRDEIHGVPKATGNAVTGVCKVLIFGRGQGTVDLRVDEDADNGNHTNGHNGNYGPNLTTFVRRCSERDAAVVCQRIHELVAKHYTRIMHSHPLKKGKYRVQSQYSGRIDMLW